MTAHESPSLLRERDKAAASLREAANRRILLFDGAMGTMIQRAHPDEAAYRGARFADWPQPLKGNNDLLSLTRPDLIRDIHTAYLEAGADIIETNTFNANRISQADYSMEDFVSEMNEAAARLAREAVNTATAADPARPRFVAGAIGPTNKTLSVSPDVSDPAYRAVTFDEMVAVYREQAQALLDGGVDFLLIETIFDTLNAKAALIAIAELEAARGEAIPLMISGTITDLAGRNLSGQTVEAFWISIAHAKPLAVGLNCSFGAGHLRPHVERLAAMADTLVLVYPNAGLPNDLGEYDESPEETAAAIRTMAADGLVNLVGGCCGTTPAHIRAIAEAVADLPPRRPAQQEPRLMLAGLEPFVL